MLSKVCQLINMQFLMVGGGQRLRLLNVLTKLESVSFELVDEIRLISVF